MHGLIFETSVWLLAESTRLLSSLKKTNQRDINVKNITLHTRSSSFKRGVSQCFQSPTPISHSTLTCCKSQHAAPKRSTGSPTTENPSTKIRKQQNNEVHLLVNSPAEANLNVPRTLELTKVKITHMKQLHAHIFTHSEQQPSFHMQSNHVKQSNQNKIVMVHASLDRHCTNYSKDTVTQSETANQHPTTKRTHCKRATPLAAKRSVVTSDATETGKRHHSQFRQPREMLKC